MPDVASVRRRLSMYARSSGLSEREGAALADGIAAGLPPSATMDDAMRTLEEALEKRMPSPLPEACVAPQIRRRSMVAAPLEYFPRVVRLLRKAGRLFGAGRA